MEPQKCPRCRAEVHMTYDPERLRHHHCDKCGKVWHSDEDDDWNDHCTGDELYPDEVAE